MISNEDIDTVISRTDDRYIKREDCDGRHKVADEKFVNLTLAYTETKTQFKLLMGILCFIGTTVLGILIKMFIGG